MIPLKPGYAISIHSSQGATLDYVIVNLGNKEFATGLTYVAPTRVRKIENMYFDPMPTYHRLNLGNREFATGLTYVAPTRMRKIENLYFDPMPTYHRLKSMAKTKIFAERRKQDEREKPQMQSMWLKPMKRTKTKRILKNQQTKPDFETKSSIN